MAICKFCHKRIPRGDAAWKREGKYCCQGCVDVAMGENYWHPYWVERDEDAPASGSKGKDGEA